MRCVDCLAILFSGGKVYLILFSGITIKINHCCVISLAQYSKTGVCRGIPIFLIFAPKHRRVPTIYVLSKNKKNIKNSPLKIIDF